jgi:hypothetical protein
VVDFVVGVFSVKWKKSLKFHKKSKVDVVAGPLSHLELVALRYCTILWYTTSWWTNLLYHL